MTVISVAFIIFSNENVTTLIASYIGVTSLIFCAKGNPIGQILMIIFSIIYAFISYSFAYYGEMITYLGMTLPMAVFSLISWIRNPYKGNRSEVTVNKIKGKEWAFMLILSAAVTVVFYFILRHFNTANIVPSTISITTSFIAAYLTFRRTTYFGLAYAMNDVVLIVMWIMASAINKEYIPVVVCFMVFFVNDIYCFISWMKMKKRQKADLLNDSSVV
jgi:nicotinamide mononucleotide transporter PnuC